MLVLLSPKYYNVYDINEKTEKIMSRLDQKVEEENRLAFIADKKAKSLDELRATADRDIRDWLRENPEIGELVTPKGMKYYFTDWVLDRTVYLNPFEVAYDRRDASEVEHKGALDKKTSFIITKANLNRKQIIKFTDEAMSNYPYHFRLADDDGKVYFEGYSNNHSNFDPIDWAMSGYGCTDILYWDEKTRTFEPL